MQRETTPSLFSRKFSLHEECIFSFQLCTLSCILSKGMGHSGRQDNAPGIRHTTHANINKTCLGCVFSPVFLLYRSPLCFISPKKKKAVNLKMVLSSRLRGKLIRYKVRARRSCVVSELSCLRSPIYAYGCYINYMFKDIPLAQPVVPSL